MSITVGRCILKLSSPALLAALGLWSAGCKGPAGPAGDDAVIPDSLSPVIEWLAPAPDTVVDSSVTLMARAFDRVGRPGGEVADTLAWRMSFYIGGFEFAGELSDTADWIYIHRWQARNYPVAPYPLMARVWDEARNCASTPLIIVWVRH